MGDNFSGKRAGNNFPLPHRDHCYSMAFDSQGRRKLISVWMPITDVEVDSGCMYVVPREFDPSFTSDAAYHHMALLSQAEHDVAEQLDDTARGTWSSLTKTTICGVPLARVVRLFPVHLLRLFSVDVGGENMIHAQV